MGARAQERAQPAVINQVMPADAVAAPRPRPGTPPGANPTQPGGSPAAQPGSPNEPKPDGKPADAPASDAEVERPSSPPRTPDPRELEVKPDKSGRVPFNFTGQPWPDVLQWLANISNYSLDWQELPPGYLNLTTQRSYTLPEARDLINRHLQARGFTLVLSGEVLSVFKLDKVDPSLVPTVDEAELYDRQPHDLVKITFQLPAGMEVAKAAEDFKKVLSANAKLLPLSSSNRVLAIDAAVNLRLVSELLSSERIAEEGREIPRRFVLKYARAEKVIETLYVVLGMNPTRQPSQAELQMEMQRMQMQQQMRQQQGNNQPQPAEKDKPKVYLAFNQKENSILANAEPSEMRIIERTVRLLDIPSGDAAADLEHTAGRFPQTYQLENMDPTSLLETLTEIGDLDPLTELRADSKADLLFVRGAQRDHDKVQKIIDQLDTGGPVFEVFQLRYHSADAVAGTVMNLLGASEDENMNSTAYYYKYVYGGGAEEEESTLKLTADVEKNRLLARGTPKEVEQVRSLLRELGELDGRAVGDGPMTRVMEPLDPERTAKILEQLRSAWPAAGGGAELLIDNQQDPAEAPADEPESPAAAEKPGDQSAAAAAAGGAVFRLVAGEAPVDPDASDAAPTSEVSLPAKLPPVSVTVTPDGRIVLTSDDPEALARTEDLINTLAPREESFHEFKIQHVDAYYIWYDLEDYFEDDLDEEDPYARYYSYIYGSGQQEESAMMSKKPKLRFLYIIQTNSVIVANASPQQVETIDKLIKMWDQPPRDTDITNRRTGIVKVSYSSPTKIANALKEVYRDLLSSRDKEFQTEGEKAGSSSTAARTTKIEFVGVEAAADAVASEPRPLSVRFDGALSIGVDEVAGMLLISARTEIYDDVVRMITMLDEEARPNHTLQVRKVSAAQAEAIQRALSSTLGKTWVGSRPEETAQPQQPQQDQGQQPGMPGQGGPPRGFRQGGGGGGNRGGR